MEELRDFLMGKVPSAPAKQATACELTDKPVEADLFLYNASLESDV